MKKPLTEDVQQGVPASRTFARYGYTDLRPRSSSTSNFTVTGSHSVIRRSPGPPQPEKEKSFTRSLVSYTVENGDVEFVEGGGIDKTVSRVTGSFSAQSGGNWYHPSIAGAFGNKPASVNAFFTRYSLTSLAGSLDLRSQAEVKALNKLRDTAKLSDLDFGVLFGERRETAKLLRDVTVGTMNVMVAILNKDYRRCAHELKRYFGVRTSAASERRRLREVEKRIKAELKRVPTHAERVIAGTEGAILGYNLGVSPLVSDLKAGVAALTSPAVFTGFDVKVKASYSRTINDEVAWDWDSERSCRSHATVSETHGYTVTLKCRPRWTTQALLSRLGIASYSLGWELTRLSFLVDYVLAVGPWLSALNALHEFEWVDGSYTQRLIRIIKIKTRSTTRVSRGRASGEGLVNLTKRNVYTDMPLPAPPMSRRIRNISSTDAQDAQAKRALNEAALASSWIRDVLRGVISNR